MSQPGTTPTVESAQPSPTAASTLKHTAVVSVRLMSYPKVIFLYPTWLMSIVAAVIASCHGATLDPSNTMAAGVGTLFLGILAVNVVILAFDFPRTTSLTLFFFVMALVLGFVLLCTFAPDLLPWIAGVLKKFRPLANASFYWTFAMILGVIFAAVFVVIRFDFWEVRPNELLHHHGFLSNLERFSAPGLRIDKEINDVFEYMLLRSGRLILHNSDDRQTIILDNVPFINKKEAAITRMLGALQVELRTDTATS